jgi:protein-tyrosine phosphatase
MRQVQRIDPYRLWIGKVQNVRDVSAALAAGVKALVDVACDDATVSIPRALIFCRFPLADGPGNPDWVLRAAISTTAALLRQHTPTMVACSAGMSRSVVVASAALSLASDRKADSCLDDLKREASTAVSPGLWRNAKAVLADLIGGT